MALRTSTLVDTKNESDEIDLGHLFSTLWRGKLWILLAGLFGLLIGILYAFVLAIPVYTATASLVLEQEQTSPLGMDIEAAVTGLSGDQPSLNTEVEVLRSRSLVERLVLELDLLEDPEFNTALRPEPLISVGKAVEAAKTVLGRAPEENTRSERETLDAVIDVILSKLSVSNQRQSYVFLITVTTTDPRKSARIANTLGELYIEDQIRVKFDRAKESAVWLSEEAANLQIELEAAEEELSTFRSQTDLISSEAFTALNRQLKELRDRRTNLRMQVDMLEARADTFETVSEPDALIAAIRSANDPVLNTALAEIDESRSADELDQLAQRALARTESDIARSKNQIAALTQSIGELEERIEGQAEELVTLQQLEREAQASRLIYEAFLTRLKETSVQQGIQQADSRVLSAAVVPRAPSAPRKSLLMALSLVLGLMVGAGGVLAREMAQNTIRTPEELEAVTGYTVLGQIPQIRARKRASVVKYLVEKPSSAAAEAIRNLRTSLMLANLDRKPQIILSTSSVPGEGKTTQSLALAQNFTGLGEKVLLVEGDIRKRVFREYFNFPGEKGLIAVLTGEARLEDVVQFSDILQADVLIGENASVNAADLYSSDRFAKFLQDLRGKYDRIIVDAPPVLAVPDARIMGQVVDAVIYTVKWDSTTKRQVKEGLGLLNTVNVPVSGLVLSQISPKGMKKYGYGDSYTAYAGYYQN